MQSVQIQNGVDYFKKEKTWIIQKFKILNNSIILNNSQILVST
jgi:hypothetical protein